MAKPEWGTKRSCDSCGAKFYDFHRDPIICPKCDTKITLTTATRPKRNRSARPETAAEEKPPAASEDDKVAAEIDNIEEADDGDVDDDTLLDDDDEFEGEIIDVNAGGDGDEKETKYRPVPGGSEKILAPPGPVLIRVPTRARESGAAETCGAVAQLGERLNGIQEVEGSTPFGSTIRPLRR